MQRKGGSDVREGDGGVQKRGCSIGRKRRRSKVAATFEYSSDAQRVSVSKYDRLTAFRESKQGCSERANNFCVPRKERVFAIANGKGDNEVYRAFFFKKK